jgi:hypothetical protein
LFFDIVFDRPAVQVERARDMSVRAITRFPLIDQHRPLLDGLGGVIRADLRDATLRILNESLEPARRAHAGR